MRVHRWEDDVKCHPFKLLPVWTLRWEELCVRIPADLDGLVTTNHHALGQMCWGKGLWVDICKSMQDKSIWKGIFSLCQYKQTFLDVLCFWYIQILGELLVCSRLGKSWKWVMAYHGRSSPSFSMRSRHQSSAWKATYLGRDGAGVTIPILMTFDMSKVISSKSSHHICDMFCSISGNFQISFGCV